MSLRTLVRGLIHGTKSPASESQTSKRKETGSTPSGVESSIRIDDGGRREDARELIGDFLPMFQYPEEQGVDYCVVGGLAVLIHAYLVDSDDLPLRSTRDADLMLGNDFTNADFSEAYIASFSSDAETGKEIYESMFGNGCFEELSLNEQALVNCSFVGADRPGPCPPLPSFDVARSLNGYRLDDLETMEVDVSGVKVTIATPAQLMEMKKRTVELLSKGPFPSPRTQDYIDIRILSEVIERGPQDEAGNDSLDDR